MSDWIGLGFIAFLILCGVFALWQLSKPYNVTTEEFERRAKEGPGLISAGLVGLQKARDLILFGEKFTAHEALSMGIAWKVVPDTELRAEAQRVGERIAALPKGAVSDLKQLLNRASAMDIDGAMAMETEFTVRQFLDPETQARARKFAKG